MKKPQIELVIRDMDNLTLNTEWIYFNATAQIFMESAEIELTDEMYDEMLGKPGAEIAKTVIPQYCLQITFDDYMARREELALEIISKGPVEPMHFARESLEYSLAERVLNCFATAAIQSEALLKLQVAGLMKYGVSLFSQSDIDLTGPKSDLFILASGVLGIQPSRCLVYEDTSVGALEAQAAGMHCIAVPSSKKETDFGNALVYPNLEAAHNDLANNFEMVPSRS
ncbi:HAD family hydrolase [Nanoarchaeota archaeon]